MHKRVQEQIKKAKKMGISPLELAAMKETARKAAERQIQEMREETLERAFLLMISIPLNVLCAFYWPKMAKSKAKKFVKECFNLYQMVLNEEVTDEDLSGYIQDTTGMKLKELWEEYKNENSTSND